MEPCSFPSLRMALDRNNPCTAGDGYAAEGGAAALPRQRTRGLAKLAPRASVSAMLLSCMFGTAHAASGANEGSADAGGASGDGGSRSESSQSRQSGSDLPVPLFDRQIVVIGDRAIVSQLSDIQPEQDYRSEEHTSELQSH